MEKTNLEYQLALWLTPGIGPSLEKAIIEQYPKLQEFFALDTNALKNIGFSSEVINKLKRPNWSQVEATLEWCQKPDRFLLQHNTDDYPAQLAEISVAPTVLLAQGNKNLLKYSKLGIVGSRNPTSSGLAIARSYAKHLAQQGLIITSGMALGIDAAAHEGAGENSIAVLGTGVDVCYPKRHSQLANTIGLCLSEFPLGTPAQAKNFPRRNRIISGLSLGTFVVEAAVKSGSLITARYALEQGREVFTIPSSIHNPMAKGCHWLIKQGATLIESVEEIWQQLTIGELILNTSQSNQTVGLDITKSRPHVSKLTNKLNKNQQQLLDVMGFDRISANALRQRTTLSVEQLSIELLELEIFGLIETVPGGVQRTPGT